MPRFIQVRRWQNRADYEIRRQELTCVNRTHLDKSEQRDNVLTGGVLAYGEREFKEITISIRIADWQRGVTTELGDSVQEGEGCADQGYCEVA
jgi:hypothetical protein